MGTGILICGLNGSGKTTLGAALAKDIGFHFIDSESLYFPDGRDYSAPRSRNEAERLLIRRARRHPDFVLAAVRYDFGPEVASMIGLAVALRAGKDARMERIRRRSFEKFGERMLPGGDLRAREEAFFEMAAARDDGHVESRLAALACPVVRLDGTRPVHENITRILATLRQKTSP